MCTHWNRLDEAILMSTNNIHFHDKIRKFPCSLVLSENILVTQKLVRINHGKRAVGVRAIEVRLFFF